MGGDGKQGNTYDLTLDAAAVDSKVAEVREELLGAVLALHKLEQVWGIVDELTSTPKEQISIIHMQIPQMSRRRTVVQVLPLMKTS